MSLTPGLGCRRAGVFLSSPYGHKQKMFAAFDSKATDLPVTDWLTERVISLPIHTEMEQEQLEAICNAVAEFAQK